MDRARSVGNSPMWLRSQLVIAVGHAIQQQLRDHAWPSDPLLCLSAAAGPMRCNRQARQCLIEMPLQDSRTAFKTSKLLRKVRLTTPLHKAWADAAYMRRYLVATRKHFINGLSYGYTCDKSRKRERLAGMQSAGAFSRHHRLVRACGRKLRN